MKNTQSKIKTIKVGNNLEQRIVLGVKKTFQATKSKNDK